MAYRRIIPQQSGHRVALYKFYAHRVPTRACARWKTERSLSSIQDFPCTQSSDATDHGFSLNSFTHVWLNLDNSQ